MSVKKYYIELSWFTKKSINSLTSEKFVKNFRKNVCYYTKKKIEQNYLSRTVRNIEHFGLWPLTRISITNEIENRKNLKDQK